MVGRQAVLRLAEGLLHRVERARPDITVDDPEGRQREDREALPRGMGVDPMVASGVRGRWCGVRQW